MTERRTDTQTRSRVDEIFDAQERFQTRFGKFATRVIMYGLLLGLGVTVSLVLFGFQQSDIGSQASDAKKLAERVDRGVERVAVGLQENKTSRRKNYTLVCEKFNRTYRPIRRILANAPPEVLRGLSEKDRQGFAEVDCDREARELIP